METTNATSFASPLANAKYVASALPAQLEPVINAIANASIWQILLTLLVTAVLYDQSEFSLSTGLPFLSLRSS